jgi:hypothetical protein
MYPGMLEAMMSPWRAVIATFAVSLLTQGCVQARQPDATGLPRQGEVFTFSGPDDGPTECIRFGWDNATGLFAEPRKFPALDITFRRQPQGIRYFAANFCTAPRRCEWVPPERIKLIFRPQADDSALKGEYAVTLASGEILRATFIVKRITVHDGS